MVRILIAVVSLVLITVAWGNDVAQALYYTGNLDSPPDGLFRNSPNLTGVEETYLPPPFASSHAANLLDLRSGDIICTWFSGIMEGASEVAIMFARLPHLGRQWSTPQRVDHHSGESYQNPVPFETPDGHIWIFHTAQAAGKGQSQARVLVTISSDAGQTWSPPSLLFDTPGSFVRQPLLVLADRRWMLPMYVTPNQGVTKSAGTNFSLIKVTADGGDHWADIPIPNSMGYVQPNVLRLKNGKFLAFFRSRYADYIYKSTSDDGSVWTAPRKTILPNNNSSIQAVQLTDGRLAIAFNNVGGVVGRMGANAGTRKPLSVALSDDEGQTWRWVRDLETGRAGREAPTETVASNQPGVEEYSYPSIIQAADGTIYVAYTYRRETIKIVRFNPDWIKAGTTAGIYKGRS